MNYDRRNMLREGANRGLEIIQASGWPPNFGGADVSGVPYSLGPQDSGYWGVDARRVDVGAMDGGGQLMFP